MKRKYDSAVGEILIDPSHSERFRNTVESGEAYEPILHRELEERLEPGQVFFDIGARFGYFSILAESLGCITYAFEQDCSFYPYLESNIQGSIIFGRAGFNVEVDFFDFLNPSIILVDVEGDEVSVLKSSENIIREQNPVVFVEIHPWELDEEDYGEISNIFSEYHLQWTDHRDISYWNEGVGSSDGPPTYLLKATR